jgi:hypothetical protein
LLDYHNKKCYNIDMKIIEVLIYTLGILEFPFDETQKCRPQAEALIDKHAEALIDKHTVFIDYIDNPIYWAKGDYWLGEDGKHYRLAGFRCIDKETGKEIGKSDW